MNIRNVVAMLFLTITALSSVVGAAFGQAYRTSFSTEVALGLGTPEKVWAEGGITHIRNQTYFSETTPLYINSIQIEVLGVANFNLSAEGQGTAHGTFEFRAVDGSGSWTGTFSGIVRDGLINNRFTGQGNGALSGTTIQGIYAEHAPLNATLSGDILYHGSE